MMTKEIKDELKIDQELELAELQDKLKRQPEMYDHEFKRRMGIFKEKWAEFKEAPGKKDEDVINYLKFMAHISGTFKKDIPQYLSNEIIDALEQYYSVLHPAVRITMVTCLKIMRGKDIVTPQLILPVFFKLFKCKDKPLREFLNTTIITDLKRLNHDRVNNNVNRKLQNFIFSMLQDPNEGAAKRSLKVMIELYKRHVWNDEKTVNVISEGCLSPNPKVVTIACQFFLATNVDIFSEDEESSA
jgi:protein SDA1